MDHYHTIVGLGVGYGVRTASCEEIRMWKRRLSIDGSAPGKVELAEVRSEGGRPPGTCPAFPACVEAVVAESDLFEIWGYCSFAIAKDQRTRRLEMTIEALCVKNELRGEGIEECLLDRVMTIARARGCDGDPRHIASTPAKPVAAAGPDADHADSAANRPGCLQGRQPARRNLGR